MARIGSWLPGGVLLAYLGGTVALFFFGPWRYPLTDIRPLVVFLALAHLALAAGYLAGIRGPGRAPRRFRIDPRRAAIVCLVCDLVLLTPTSHYNTGAWIPNPVAAIGDLGGAYSRSLALREQGVPIANYARILAAPLLAAGMPLCVFYWRRLGWMVRGLFILSTVGTLSLFISMGANAGAAHWVLLFPWFVAAAVTAGEQRIGRRAWIALGAVLVTSVLLFGVLFGTSMNVRAGSFARAGVLSGLGAALKKPEAGTPRSAVRVAVDGLAAYVSHGYFAVYLSLREPFLPMYGVGNSVFLQRQVARATGNPYWVTQAYPFRIEPQGWNAYGYWATIYPWIASDVGFAGTVVVMFLIGLLFGKVWTDVTGAQNPWAVMMLGQVLLLLYYIPAHNKVMHSGEGVVAFGTLLILWLASRQGAGRRAPAMGPP